MASIRKIPSVMCLTLLSGYQQLIRPFLPKSCRFYPSCSDYMIHAIQEKGVFKGGMLGIYRLCRCHPFSKGGVDFVK